MGELARGLAVAAAVAVLVASWRRARSLRVSPEEERFFRVFNEAPNVVYVPVWAIMQAGSFGAVWVLGAVLWRRDEHPETVVTIVLGTIVWAGVKRLKPLIGRGRPGALLTDVHVRGQAQTGLGYPSGHAAVSLTLALVAFGGATVGVQLAVIGVALVTGGARMYVGAHLPLDLAGGFAIAVIVGEIGAAGIAAGA